MMVDDDNKLRFCRSEVGICTLKFTCLLLLQHGLACTFLFERKVRKGQSISWPDFHFLKKRIPPTWKGRIRHHAFYVEEQCSLILRTKRVLNLTNYVCEVWKLRFFLDHDFAIQQFPSYPVDRPTTESITESHFSRSIWSKHTNGTLPNHMDRT